MTDFIASLQKHKCKVHVFSIRTDWLDIGHHSALKSAREIFGDDVN